MNSVLALELSHHFLRATWVEKGRGSRLAFEGRVSALSSVRGGQSPCAALHPPEPSAVSGHLPSLSERCRNTGIKCAVKRHERKSLLLSRLESQIYATQPDVNTSKALAIFYYPKALTKMKSHMTR